ncbi:MAG: SDR family oxidoreductase [Erysipelotrichaceae bacterium]|nr:SDR family oxidoreductase [Erysipelotrichaceae bacterium]
MAKYQDVLKDKVVVITGTTSGIGRRMATLFAEQGAKVVGSGRRENLGQEMVEEIKSAGGEAIFVKTDASDPEQVKNLIDKAVETYGRLDILVNNCALEPQIMIKDLTWEQFREVIDTNLGSYTMATVNALRYMVPQQSGKILNINSVTREQIVPGVGVYSLAKAAIHNLTKVVALEHARDGIRCNEICPGLILSGAFTDPAVREWAKDSIENGTPVPRLGTVDEIAYTALFMLSDELDFLNDGSLFVDGGRHLI